MTDNIWLGSIYLKDEGGYDIVLNALNHYKKRLRTVSSSPELSEAPMFVQIVQQEAMKTFPEIDSIINKLNEGLKNPKLLSSLQEKIPTILKALNSYQSDLQKALASQHEYYTNLIPDSQNHKDDLPLIQKAITKINEYS